MAEGARFELARPCGLSVFKTDALDHSATPPIRRGYSADIRRAATAMSRRTGGGGNRGSAFAIRHRE